MVKRAGAAVKDKDFEQGILAQSNVPLGAESQTLDSMSECSSGDVTHLGE